MPQLSNNVQEAWFKAHQKKLADQQTDESTKDKQDQSKPPVPPQRRKKRDLGDLPGLAQDQEEQNHNGPPPEPQGPLT